MSDIQLVFGDLEDDDVYDPSDIDPGAVGLLFGIILANVLRERPELNRKQRLRLAERLLAKRLAREGSL